MKALITGGTGFIGSHLVEKLVQEGFSVRVVARGESPNLLPPDVARKTEIMAGDISDQATCEKAVRGCELVSHLACLVNEDKSLGGTNTFWATNAGGTMNMLRAALMAKVSRFHYMSGPSLVGNVPPPSKAGEDWAIPAPQTPYAQVKLLGELCCQGYFKQYDLPIVIIRPFNVYGPRQSPLARGGMITRFILDVIKREPIRIDGDGEQSRDWLYVTDLVDAIYRCLATKGMEGEVFHVASGQDTKVRDVAKLVARVCGIDYDLQPRFERGATAGIQRSCGDSSKARRLLGWMPSVDLKQGVELTFDYLNSAKP